ncbi:MAG: hypothetical protein HY548_00200 [Elusimicrobia bacterium]|nr:hypothetical protein [Elusimicrobiota bacterium]
MSRAEAKTPRPEMIRLLQQALRLEYEDVFLYLRESSLFKKKLIRGERLGQIFSRFCDSEISHADRVATALM